MSTLLTFSTSIESMHFYPHQLLYVCADGNYSTLVFTDGYERLLLMQLGQMEREMDRQLQKNKSPMMRIGRSLIVNTDYISYIQLQQMQLELWSGSGKRYHITASREALKQLKDYLENKK